MRDKRAASALLLMTVLMAGCGQSQMTHAEYLDAVTEIVDEAGARASDLYGGERGALLTGAPSEIGRFEPTDLSEVLLEVGAIEMWILEQAAGIEPPDELAEFHAFFFGDTYTTAREDLATRAAVAADWAELSGTPEMAAYRAAIAGDKAACEEYQRMIAGTQTGEAFEDMPWIPGDLQEVARGAMACEWYPEHPELMFDPAAG